VANKSKEPVEGEWNKPENLMCADDPRLQAWLAEGGNYGVAAGYGIGILDADHEEIKQFVLSRFPSTFTVESPGSKAPHYYFLSNLTGKMFLRTKSGDHAGEILWEGFMAVGPGSIHPNGQPYRIINDAPLAMIPKNQLATLLGDHLVPEKQTMQTEETARKERQQTDVDLDILQVVPLAGLKKQGDEYYGSHPIHGSETGRNFWVNPRKNCWHCFRHGTGGGPLLWLAVEEGLIDCGEAGPGALCGPLFKQVLEKAVERGLVKKTETKVNQKKHKKPTKDEEPTLVDQLIGIALGSDIELFEDDRGDGYAVLDGGGHREIHPLEGKSFERWLRQKYFEAEHKGLRKETLNDACATLAAIAQFQESHVKRELHNRVAWHDDAIYYDLADEKWRAIKISSQGWEIIDDPPPLFRRFPHQQAQVIPTKNGSLDELFKFINITNPKDQLLMKVYAVVLLIPGIPHPIFLVGGPQGCGKSDLMRVIRKLVDPSAVLLQSFRYDELEMALKVFHHYLVYFDNMSSIKQWLSDILCRACTGQGFTKRKLYTDEDSVIFRFQRCVGVNGIALSQLSPDFLDRSLIFTLKQIPTNKRKDERQLWKEFEEARQRILGAILDALSKAIQIYPTVEIEHLPRMADFTIWGEAVSRALGYSPGEFLDAYREKIGEQVADVLEQNPIGIAILAFTENRETWEGAPGELLEALEDPEFVEKNKIDVKDDKWPKSAVWVTRRIKEIETNLEHEGVKFSTGYQKRRRIITLTKCNGNNGNNGISPTKKDDNDHVQHRPDDVGSHKLSPRNTVATVLPLQASSDLDKKDRSKMVDLDSTSTVKNDVKVNLETSYHEESPQQLGELSNSVTKVVEEEKPQPSGAMTIDNILGWLRLEFQRGNNPVLQCVLLDQVEKGTCPLCQKHNVHLTWQIQFVNGDKVDACCLNCGNRIDEEVKLFLEKESA